MVSRERSVVMKVPCAITVSSTPYLRQKIVPNEAYFHYNCESRA